MLRNDLETYTTLWKNFGRVLKEGAGFDFDNKDRLMKLYLFESSADPEKLTTLSDYLGRMKPDQKAIYFLAGPSRRAVENSPHLEAFQAKGYEVLFLVDPVDEILVQWIFEFEGKHLKSVAKGLADIGDDRDLTAKGAELSSLMDSLQSRLDATCSPGSVVGPLDVVSGMSGGCGTGHEPEPGETHEPGQGRVHAAETDHGDQSGSRDCCQDGERLKQDASIRCSMTTPTSFTDTPLLAEGSELDDSPKFNQALLRVLGKAI